MVYDAYVCAHRPSVKQARDMVVIQREELDSVMSSRRREGVGRAFGILMEAQQHWANMNAFRQERERCKRYTYGDQWGDKIVVNGKTMTEADYLKDQGKVPLAQNIIRRVVRNMVGVYIGQVKEPTCIARDRDEQRIGEVMTTVLKYNMELNKMTELYNIGIEEFLVGGLVVHRKSFGWRNDRYDCWTDNVSPERFFVDASARDIRGWDVGIVGEICDMSIAEVLSTFAKAPGDHDRLRSIYRMASDKSYMSQVCESYGNKRHSGGVIDFLMPNNPAKCRVIYVWRKEYKPRYYCHDYHTGEVFKVDEEDYEELVELENAQRLERGVSAGVPIEKIRLIEAEWRIDSYWYYYVLTPFGDILKEGESPYWHKEHPYVFRGYPFLDGEVHSFVSDIIDQQRYVNRLIMLQDMIVMSSAKGVLLVPEECIPDNMDIRDFADEWTKFNGVIAIKCKPGMPLPQQISGNATNIGIADLLSMQLKLFEDISGVNGALQGKPGYSGMSASLYAQQTQNATTSLLGVLEAFSSFVREAASKDVKNIQQCYDEKRMFNISGRNAQAVYDPLKMQDVDFDLSIVESSTTPVLRQAANEFLMEVWRAGQLSLEQLLEHGDIPNSDNLLQSIRSQKQDIENGNVPEGLDPSLMQQVHQGANQGTVNHAMNMLRS